MNVNSIVNMIGRTLLRSATYKASRKWGLPLTAVLGIVLVVLGSVHK